NEVAALATAAASASGRPHAPKSHPDASTSGMMGARNNVPTYIPAHQRSAPRMPAPCNFAAATAIQWRRGSSLARTHRTASTAAAAISRSAVRDNAMRRYVPFRRRGPNVLRGPGSPERGFSGACDGVLGEGAAGSVGADVRVAAADVAGAPLDDELDAGAFLNSGSSAICACASAR